MRVRQDVIPARNFVQFHNWTEFAEIREFMGLDQCGIGLVCSMTIEVSELDGTDSRAELVPAMFNIAE